MEVWPQTRIISMYSSVCFARISFSPPALKMITIRFRGRESALLFDANAACNVQWQLS